MVLRAFERGRVQTSRDDHIVVHRQDRRRWNLVHRFDLARRRNRRRR